MKDCVWLLTRVSNHSNSLLFCSSRPGRPPKRAPVGLSLAASHLQHQQLKKHRMDNGDYPYENGHMGGKCFSITQQLAPAYSTRYEFQICGSAMLILVSSVRCHLQHLLCESEIGVSPQFHRCLANLIEVASSIDWRNFVSVEICNTLFC